MVLNDVWVRREAGATDDERLLFKKKDQNSDNDDKPEDHLFIAQNPTLESQFVWQTEAGQLIPPTHLGDI